MTQHTLQCPSLLNRLSPPTPPPCTNSVLSPWASVVISHIPIPVVLGVFLYLAYISLYGVQLVHRLKLLFIPSKYHREMPFTKSIRLWKLNVYTTTQLVLVAGLWVVKLTPVAMFYPGLVILLIPIHKFIKRFIFTKSEVNLVSTALHNPDVERNDVYVLQSSVTPSLLPLNLHIFPLTPLLSSATPHSLLSATPHSLPSATPHSLPSATPHSLTSGYSYSVGQRGHSRHRLSNGWG